MDVVVNILMHNNTYIGIQFHKQRKRLATALISLVVSLTSYSETVHDFDHEGYRHVGV